MIAVKKIKNKICLKSIFLRLEKSDTLSFCINHIEISGAIAPIIAPMEPQKRLPPHELNKITPQKIQLAITPGSTDRPNNKNIKIFAPIGKYRYEPTSASKPASFIITIEDKKIAKNAIKLLNKNVLSRSIENIVTPCLNM